jgi:hypothetical protein
MRKGVGHAVLLVQQTDKHRLMTRSTTNIARAHRCLRLEEGVRAGVQRAIARVELELTETEGNDTREHGLVLFFLAFSNTYTGPDILLALALICELPLGGCALAIITRPAVWLPLASPDDCAVVATR